MADLVRGQKLVGFVHDIQEDFLWLNITPTLRGRVPCLHVSLRTWICDVCFVAPRSACDNNIQASLSPAVIKDLIENFKLGQRLECYVLAAVTEPPSLELSLTKEGAIVLSIAQLTNRSGPARGLCRAGPHHPCVAHSRLVHCAGQQRVWQGLPHGLERRLRGGCGGGERVSILIY